MINIYKNLYRNNKSLGKLQNNPRIKVMAHIANKLNLENKNILDIGCYDGTFLALIKNRSNDFYGVEASDYGVIESSKKKIHVEQFFFDDKTKIPYDDNFFDLIIAGEIIEHIYDTDFFLEEIKRLLKSNGKLIISTPNVASLGRRLLLLIGKSPIIEDSPNESDSSGHIRYFTFETLRNLLNKHDFELIEERSDVVNFSSGGFSKSKLLARIFPRIGQSVIALCRNRKVSKQ